MAGKKLTLNIINDTDSGTAGKDWKTSEYSNIKHKFHWKGTEPFYLDQLKNLKLSGIQKAKADQVKSNFWK